MARREEDTVTLTCPLTDIEQDICAEMMRMLGITSQGNLVRVGLWHLARHLDIPIGNGVFMKRTTHGVTYRGQPTRLHERQLSLDEISAGERTA